MYLIEFLKVFTRKALTTCTSLSAGFSCYIIYNFFHLSFWLTGERNKLHWLNVRVEGRENMAK